MINRPPRSSLATALGLALGTALALAPPAGRAQPAMPPAGEAPDPAPPAPLPSFTPAAAPSDPGASTACPPPASLSGAEAPPDALAAALCADPAARLADRRRAQAYRVLHDQLPPAQKPGLEADARSFAAFLAATCAREGPDAACLARAHAAKREDLRRWLLPEAREEADRDPAEAEALDRRLAARGIPAEPPARRREAIAALQRAAGLPPSGFLDARTAAAAEPPRPAPAPAPGLPAGAFWSPALPALLQESYALTTCAEPTLTWLGRGLLLGGRPLPGESGYEIYGHEGPQGDQVFLVPRGGTPRVVEVRRDGTLRLSGTIPPALAERGVTPETALQRCEAAPAPVPPPARTRPGGESRAPAPRA
ncbi:peptidoglycan-binding domain-containing protein, partial [Muricoccus nepalensis]|uniref:peptidoglycan-binding domain-containing protein n=1 Tax=Muricoccus nepalensis TaxID=1854500 RepID=UPI00112B5D94